MENKKDEYTFCLNALKKRSDDLYARFQTLEGMKLGGLFNVGLDPDVRAKRAYLELESSRALHEWSLLETLKRKRVKRGN